MKTFTRQKVVDIARSLLGWKYQHQGRGNLQTVDCIGLLTVVADRLGYKYTDLESYRRTPAANKLYELLCENLDEIPLSEVGIGDIFLLRLGGIKPRHTAFKASDVTDIEKGLQPTMIHALNTPSINSVVEQPIELYRGQLCKGFRLRGIKI